MYEVEFSLYERPQVFKMFENMISAIRDQSGRCNPKEIIGLIKQDHGIELGGCAGNGVSPARLYQARFRDQQHFVLTLLKYG